MKPVDRDISTLVDGCVWEPAVCNAWRDCIETAVICHTSVRKIASFSLHFTLDNKLYFHPYYAMKRKKERAVSLRSCEVIVICRTMC